jgi:hypothetical protein
MSRGNLAISDDVAVGVISTADVDPARQRILARARVLRIVGQVPYIGMDVPYLLLEYEYELDDTAAPRRTARLLVASDTAADLGLALLGVAEQVGVTPAQIAEALHARDRDQGKPGR